LFVFESLVNLIDDDDNDDKDVYVYRYTCLHFRRQSGC